MPPAGHRKRVREELQGADGRHARAEMGPPASGNKRSCAGTGAQQARMCLIGAGCWALPYCSRSKPQRGHKGVLLCCGAEWASVSSMPYLPGSLCNNTQAAFGVLCLLYRNTRHQRA